MVVFHFIFSCVFLAILMKGTPLFVVIYVIIFSAAFNILWCATEPNRTKRKLHFINKELHNRKFAFLPI